MANQPIPDAPQTASPFTTPPARKKRHGCLTALLVFIIVINLFAAFFTWLGAGVLAEFLENEPATWVTWFNVIISLLVVVFAIAIFIWKKWGFWGLVAIQIINIVVSAVSGNVFSVVSSIIGALIAIGILYGVLQIGNEDKGWPQLE